MDQHSFNKTYDYRSSKNELVSELFIFYNVSITKMCIPFKILYLHILFDKKYY